MQSRKGDRSRRSRARAYFPALRDWLDTTKTRQCEFAAMMGISTASVSRLLNAERGMSVKMAVRVALATGIPVEQLLLDRQTRLLVRLLSDQQGKKDVAAREAQQELSSE